MEEKIRQVGELLRQIVDEDVASGLAVDVIENEYEIIVQANRRGMLSLAEQLVALCERNVAYGHYHLDGCGIAHRCDKPVVVTFVNS